MKKIHVILLLLLTMAVTAMVTYYVLETRFEVDELEGNPGTTTHEGLALLEHYSYMTEETKELSEQFTRLTYEMVWSSIKNNGTRPDEYKDIISADKFERLDFKSGNYDDNEISKYMEIFYPESFFKDNKIFCIFMYRSYALQTTDNKEPETILWDIPITVTYELVDGKWVVTGIFEPA